MTINSIELVDPDDSGLKLEAFADDIGVGGILIEIHQDDESFGLGITRHQARVLAETLTEWSKP